MKFWLYSTIKLMHAYVVVVGTAPNIIKRLSPQTALSGSRVEFVCDIDLGSPEPDIVWEKQGRQVKTSDRVQTSVEGSKLRLTINDCTVDDVGLYGVRVSNKLGTAESEASLTVNCKLMSTSFV